MKLQDLILEKETKTEGSYIAVNFSKESQKRLHEFSKKLKIKNLVPEDKYHITIIYSTKPVPKTFKAKGELDPPILANPKHLTIFPTQDKKRALVIELTCKKIVNRHRELMDKYDLKFGFPSFKPHITLSYDCEEFEIPDDLDYSLLEDLEIVNEYHEALNLDWAKENT